MFHNAHNACQLARTHLVSLDMHATLLQLWTSVRWLYVVEASRHEHSLPTGGRLDAHVLRYASKRRGRAGRTVSVTLTVMFTVVRTGLQFLLKNGHINFSVILHENI